MSTLIGGKPPARPTKTDRSIWFIRRTGKRAENITQSESGLTRFIMKWATMFFGRLRKKRPIFLLFEWPGVEQSKKKPPIEEAGGFDLLPTIAHGYNFPAWLIFGAMPI